MVKISIIIDIVLFLLCLHFGLLFRKMKKVNRQLIKKANTERLSLYFNLLMEWMANKQNNKTMSAFFEENKIKKVIIYGMGNLEELLFIELKSINIEMCGFVDQNAKAYQEFFENVVTVEEIEQFSDADAVIVTPFFAFESIKKNIKEKIDIKVISIEQLVFDMK